MKFDSYNVFIFPFSDIELFPDPLYTFLNQETYLMGCGGHVTTHENRNSTILACTFYPSIKNPFPSMKKAYGYP